MSGAVGEMAVPLSLAFVFEQGTADFVFLIYILGSTAALCLVVLGAFVVVARLRRQKNKQYNEMDEEEEHEGETLDDVTNGHIQMDVLSDD